MSKADRAIKALREAADALDDLPMSLRLVAMIGPYNSPAHMRKEAKYIEGLIKAVREADDGV